MVLRAKDNRRYCRLIKLGLVDYQGAWDLQQTIAGACHDSGFEAALILLEHPPTYTLGRGGNEGNILVEESSLSRLGARVLRSDRGGDVTFHGPGQLVSYPIISLPRWGLDVHRYLRSLEEILLKVLAKFGIEARRVAGLTGVWVGEEKVAAIGIKVSRGITTHGFALNVNTDLSFFEHIIPCGLRDRRVTSLAELLGHPVEMEKVVEAVARRFGEEFQVDLLRGERGEEGKWGKQKEETP